ncbi:Hypothetical predicted protein [Pelobates cultripes]|uniref:Uncharacterized protein n=1 Tax=Pelobates cultripes TaxID=61616 RepID=A0AAD1WSF6_PELCU|nr:Hypothetical predicted protein [Pelobates cultripes]
MAGPPRFLHDATAEPGAPATATQKQWDPTTGHSALGDGGIRDNRWQLQHITVSTTNRDSPFNRGTNPLMDTGGNETVLLNHIKL